jgi:hypothetical protein
MGYSSESILRFHGATHSRFYAFTAHDAYLAFRAWSIGSFAATSLKVLCWWQASLHDQEGSEVNNPESAQRDNRLRSIDSDSSSGRHITGRMDTRDTVTPSPLSQRSQRFVLYRIYASSRVRSMIASLAFRALARFSLVGIAVSQQRPTRVRF